MRFFAPFLHALLFVTQLLAPRPVFPDPARELIVHLARPPLGVSSTADDARFAAHLDALALTPLRRLDDGLHPARIMAAARLSPFAFDPSRVLLVAARDAASADAARPALMADPGVVWVEPKVVRDAAIRISTSIRARPSQSAYG